MVSSKTSRVLPPYSDTFRAYQFEQLGAAENVVKLNPNMPQLPLNSTEVRVKVMSSSVNPIDCKVPQMQVFVDRHFKTLPTAEKPRRIGFDFAGIIVEAGSDVQTFDVGDEVFGVVFFTDIGAFAEYFNVDVKYIVRKPASLTFNQAGGVPLVAETTWQALTVYGKVEQGQRVLVLGGSSSTGAIGIQIAKELGASHIIATTSYRNTEYVYSLGADQVIDYTTTNWADVIEPHSIDLIYDCGFEPDSWNTGAQRVLKRDTGKFVTIGHLTTAPIESSIGATLTVMGSLPEAKYLAEPTKLIEAGKLTVPIDSIYPFENLRDAIKHVKTGRARGKVILEIAQAAP